MKPRKQLIEEARLSTTDAVIKKFINLRPDLLTKLADQVEKMILEEITGRNSGRKKISIDSSTWFDVEMTDREVDVMNKYMCDNLLTELDSAGYAYKLYTFEFTGGETVNIEIIYADCPDVPKRETRKNTWQHPHREFPLPEEYTPTDLGGLLRALDGGIPTCLFDGHPADESCGISCPCNKHSAQ